MEKSFFSRFKGKLKDDCGDLGGRYLGFLLTEVVKEEPKILKILFPNLKETITKKDISKGIYEIDTEGSFDGKEQKRRTDFYVKRKGEYTYIAQLEIKWDDQSLENQINDYIRYAQKHKDTSFTYLTKRRLNDADVKKIKKAEQNYLSCADLFKKISSLNTTNMVVNLFIKFLEENIMSYKEQLNKQALLRIMKSSIGWKHQDYLGKNTTYSMIEDIPDAWAVLLKNIGSIGEHFVEDYGKLNLFTNKPLPTFNFTSGLDVRKVSKVMKNLEADEDIMYVGTWKNIEAVAGSFALYNTVTINGVRLAFGYYFYYEDGKDNQITFTAFADVYGEDSKYCNIEKPMPLKIIGNRLLLPSEEKLYAAIKLLIKKASEKWLKENPELPKVKRAGVEKLGKA